MTPLGVLLAHERLSSSTSNALLQPNSASLLVLLWRAASAPIGPLRAQFTHNRAANHGQSLSLSLSPFHFISSPILLSFILLLLTSSCWPAPTELLLHRSRAHRAQQEPKLIVTCERRNAQKTRNGGKFVNGLRWARLRRNVATEQPLVHWPLVHWTVCCSSPAED